jgi:monodehydroascorbate reductase (NADH)
LVLGTRVKAADVRARTLLTAAGETISYKFLVIATGARVLKLEEFGVTGADAHNVCYLRDVQDAAHLVDQMAACRKVEGKAVVIGGGYIGMECAAALHGNHIPVTMVFPEHHCMARLFTPEIAAFYETYYGKKGVNFIKGNVMASFEQDEFGKVTTVVLKDGRKIAVDLVVVGIGIHPNVDLFEGQLAMEKGGIRVDGKMRSVSNHSVYAVGDVAAFPLKMYGDVRRLEHVDHARKSAAHAVQAIMSSNKVGDYDYLPYFYSRVFTLSWQFYGENVGECILFGDHSASKFGAFWVHKGQLVGAFLEGGSKAEYAALARAARQRPTVDDTRLLAMEGMGFAMALTEPVPPRVSLMSSIATADGHLFLTRPPSWAIQVGAGVAVGVAFVSLAFWYGRRKKRW